MLTEQVSAQSEKIADLERTISDKTVLLNNTEDLLQRVSAFAQSVGIQIDKQKVLFSIFYLPSIICLRIWQNIYIRYDGE